VLWFLMQGIHRHYERVSTELQAGPDEEMTLPSRVHAIILVSKVHKPTLRAVAYARASRPTTLEAITVNVDTDDTARLTADWDRRAIPVPLKVLDSPFREVTRPVVDYVRGLRRLSPRDLVTVFIPEYVVGHWWEQLLHNQSALRLKTRLLFTPGVMVVSVPWQLVSSDAAARRSEASAPGEVRRGQPLFQGPASVLPQGTGDSDSEVWDRDPSVTFRDFSVTYWVGQPLRDRSHCATIAIRNRHVKDPSTVRAIRHGSGPAGQTRRVFSRTIWQTIG